MAGRHTPGVRGTDDRPPCRRDLACPAHNRGCTKGSRVVSHRAVQKSLRPLTQTAVGSTQRSTMSSKPPVSHEGSTPGADTRAEPQQEHHRSADAASGGEMERPKRRDPAERIPSLRVFYRDWRPTRLGKLVARFWAWLCGLGLTPD